MSEAGIRRALLIAFFFSGAAALLYEVVWTRALSLVLGSTVYALSTMLSTFMAGLAIGAYIGGRVADRGKNLILYFGLLELGIGVFGIITVPLIYSIPPIYFKLYKAFHINPSIYFVSQFLLSASIMLLPAIFMGATFPIISKRLTEDISTLGKSVGSAYSLNTVGAVLGSLLAGFVLIPTLGIKWSSFAAGCLNIAVGASMAFFFSKKRALLVPFLFFPVIAIFIVKDIENEHPFLNFYLAERFKDIAQSKEVEGMHKKVFEAHYPEGTVRGYLFNKYLIIQHGGKLEGTGPGDLINTMMLALLPTAAHNSNPQDALIIGLGAGITTYTASLVMDNVSVVEINPGVVEVVRRFGLPGIIENISIIKDDGRRFLTRTDSNFDIIISEPSVPSESVSANLFTKEFYKLASSKLNPGGIFCQGVQGWKLSKQDIRVCIKTFASAFDYVYVWKSKQYRQFIMVGSKEPFHMSEDKIMLKLLAWGIIPKEHLRDIDLALILTPERVGSIKEMSDVPLNTDDKPYLEFSIAKNFIYGTEYLDFRR